MLAISVGRATGRRTKRRKSQASKRTGDCDVLVSRHLLFLHDASLAYSRRLLA